MLWPLFILPLVFARNFSIDWPGGDYNQKISLGDSVTWKWQGGHDLVVWHDLVVTSGPDTSWGTSVLHSGSYSHVFNTVGEYLYKCTIHSNMEGTITVIDNAAKPQITCVKPDECSEWTCDNWCKCYKSTGFLPDNCQSPPTDCKCERTPLSNITKITKITKIEQQIRQTNNNINVWNQTNTNNAAVDRSRKVLDKLQVKLKREQEIDRQYNVCCEANIASCLACHAGKSIADYCSGNNAIQGCKPTVCTMDMYTCPDGTLLSRNSDCAFPGCPDKTPSQCANCTKWFDGCNQCKCDADGNKKCTLKVCQKLRAPMCLDDDECDKAKSWSLDKTEECCDTGDCLNGSEQHNCLTKEVWTNKKRKWCCKSKSIGCEYLDCPHNCSSWYDGCNTCTCKEGILGACTKKKCFRQEKPRCLAPLSNECVIVDCRSNYIKVGQDKQGCGGKCVKYDCRNKDGWEPGKRAWCCINERRGCCPVVRCASPKPGCNRTWEQDINKFGCLLYPCGNDVCPKKTRTKKNPQISILDSRGIVRLSTTVNTGDDPGKVTIQIMDTRGRTRVSLGAQNISMDTGDDIIRRRNIIRSIMTVSDDVTIEIDKAGFPSKHTRYFKDRKVTDVVFTNVRSKSSNNPTNCNESDINLIRDDNNTLAFEIVLNKTGDQSFKCYEGTPLSLLTLKERNATGKNKYEVHCWYNNQWSKKNNTFEETDYYNCSRLPLYRHFIGSDVATVAVGTVGTVAVQTNNCTVFPQKVVAGNPTSLILTYKYNVDYGDFIVYNSSNFEIDELSEKVNTTRPGTVMPMRQNITFEKEGLYTIIGGSDTIACTVTVIPPTPIETPTPAPTPTPPPAPTPTPTPTTTPTTQPAPTPPPAPTPITVVFGPGVSKIEACAEDTVLVIWNGFHDLVETESADCSSNVTKEIWGTATNINQTFTILGGMIQGQTRYFKCSHHCGPDKARIEVTCPYEIAPNHRAPINMSGSDLEINGVIVASILVVIIVAILLAILYRPRCDLHSEDDEVSVTNKEVDELNELLLEKPLKWVP